ncbi:MAG: hypothetical protein H7Z43_05285 [Clostridia bacterium]|nr:hypothetical protein [Deltaproteobacteria bacterium]
MKYFSRKIMYGGVSDAESAFIVSRYYRGHLPTILQRLPAPLAEVARHLSDTGAVLSLHDGLVRSVSVDVSHCALTLSLRAGDNAVGYYDLDLTYGGVDMTRLDLKLLRRFASHARGEALYHEVDVMPGGYFVHRILLWPAGLGELALIFREFTYQRVSQPDRSFVKTEPAFSIREVGTG